MQVPTDVDAAAVVKNAMVSHFGSLPCFCPVDCEPYVAFEFLDRLAIDMYFGKAKRNECRSRRTYKELLKRRP